MPRNLSRDEEPGAPSATTGEARPVGRPKLTAERRAQALDAFTACVARYGLEGATLERVAAEAGMKRPLLRHHLGNRDDMVAALSHHVAAQFDATVRALEAALPEEDRLTALVDYLFLDARASDPTLVLAFAALTAHAAREPETATTLCASIASYERFLAREIARAHPRAAPADIEAAAHGLMALSFNLDALSPLGFPPAWRKAAHRAGEALIASLDSKGQSN